MEANIGKSCIFYEEDRGGLAMEITQMFNFKSAPLSSSFKYLGFHLKPNSYGIQDWRWIEERIKNKIGVWTSKWLSIGGRLILVQAVLQ